MEKVGGSLVFTRDEWIGFVNKRRGTDGQFVHATTEDAERLGVAFKGRADGVDCYVLPDGWDSPAEREEFAMCRPAGEFIMTISVRRSDGGAFTAGGWNRWMIENEFDSRMLADSMKRTARMGVAGGD